MGVPPREGKVWGLGLGFGFGLEKPLPPGKGVCHEGD